MKKFNFVSFLLRFFGAAVVVLATFNPCGYSYYHWVRDSIASNGSGFGAEQAFVGVVLLIGWTTGKFDIARCGCTWIVSGGGFHRYPGLAYDQLWDF